MLLLYTSGIGVPERGCSPAIFVSGAFLGVFNA